MYILYFYCCVLPLIPQNVVQQYFNGKIFMCKERFRQITLYRCLTVTWWRAKNIQAKDQPREPGLCINTRRTQNKSSCKSAATASNLLTVSPNRSDRNYKVTNSELQPIKNERQRMARQKGLTKDNPHPYQCLFCKMSVSGAKQRR